MTPVWVAHINDQESVLKDRARKKGDWSRKDDRFEPDANVVAFARSLRLPYATDASYSNANPPELPLDPKGDKKITRGHMASNREMKALGDPTTGLLSQKESFSLANVAPQMQRHNAPIWAKLEDNCLEWAAQLGRVAVISGPVFAPAPDLPAPGNKIIYTTEKYGARIPIPTHFFKIVIGERNGKRQAVGYLIPHRSDLAMSELNSFIVPIRKIEELTKINFMPRLGRNDELEAESNRRWLSLAN